MAGCGGRLRDQVLDWEDALPPKELKRAEVESKAACLALVLGRARSLPETQGTPNGGHHHLSDRRSNRHIVPWYGKSDRLFTRVFPFEER